MTNEYYGVASTPMDDYLAHYGVRGMKWGVRKAIASGNSGRLSRQFAKAQKKLAKLEKRAANSSKYAKRAAVMGAGAAAAGGLAAAGTGRIAQGITRVGGGAKHVPKAIVRAGEVASKVGLTKTGSRLIRVGNSMQVAENRGKGLTSKFAKASEAVDKWGKSTSVSDAARKGLDAVRGNSLGNARAAAALKAKGVLKGVSNNTIARIGAGAVGAGLAAGAARNAYKAATAKKKADKFRSEMNKAFAGTKYANSTSSGSSSASVSSKKRRRR